MKKVEELINQGSDRLKKKGIKTFLRDSRVLMSFVMLNKVETTYSFYTEEISQKKIRQFLFLIERRCKKEPLSRIIEQKYFWNYSFYLSPDVLDPRPETELLIEHCLKNCNEDTKIIDVGTGTGCIAVTLALELRNKNITATDISHKILKIAKKNAEKYGVNINFKKSLWFEKIKEKFDVLVSNPPYISKEELLLLDNEVLEYDPIHALTLFDDGLGAYRYFAKNLNVILNKNGQAFFEIGSTQKNDIIYIFKSNGFNEIFCFKDYYGKDRLLCVKKDA